MYKKEERVGTHEYCTKGKRACMSIVQKRKGTYDNCRKENKDAWRNGTVQNKSGGKGKSYISSKVWRVPAAISTVTVVTAPSASEACAASATSSTETTTASASERDGCPFAGGRGHGCDRQRRRNRGVSTRVVRDPVSGTVPRGV